MLYNNTNQDLYPVFDGKFWGTKNVINPEQNSGFKLEKNSFHVLELPQHVDSGRIWVRTVCDPKAQGYTPGGKADTISLNCDTGNCPIPWNAFNESKQGLLCYDSINNAIIGGIPPTTPIEFTFDNKNIDYYDISQVDGNNISVMMRPISKSKSKTDVDPSIKDEFWCNTPECFPIKDKSVCPSELRTYDNDGNYISCSSLCKNLSMYKSGAPDFKGLLPNGKPSNNIVNLKKYDKKGFDKLTEIYNSKYIWDSSKESDYFDKERPWTKKGRWVLNNKGPCTDSEQKSGNCLSTETVTCCEGSCPDPDKGPTLPTLQGCSPYTKTYKDADKYKKHLCWSQTWPKLDKEFCKSSGLFTDQEIENGECNYHSIFKKQCPKAYSWQFDDESSTFKCAGINNLMNYLIIFCDRI